MIRHLLSKTSTVALLALGFLLFHSQLSRAQTPPPPPPPPPPPVFSFCASEGARCEFTGTRSLWVTWCSSVACSSVSSGSATNGVLCAPASFGMTLPAGYTRFTCYVSSGETGPATLTSSATASTQSGIGRAASLAIDGDTTTRWEASNSSAGSWLQVKGSAIFVSRIEVREYGDRIRGFRLEYKSLFGGQWTRIAEGTFVGHLVIDTQAMPAMPTDTVRLITTARANGQPSIAEFVVTGNRIATP